jgi:hypothetical protein
MDTQQAVAVIAWNWIGVLLNGLLEQPAAHLARAAVPTWRLGSPQTSLAEVQWFGVGAIAPILALRENGSAKVDRDRELH